MKIKSDIHNVINAASQNSISRKVGAKQAITWRVEVASRGEAEGGKYPWGYGLTCL